MLHSLIKKNKNYPTETSINFENTKNLSLSLHHLKLNLKNQINLKYYNV